MLIIPVIDLYAGNVVHAIAGKRQSYRNIQSPLCPGSEPLRIVQSLMGLHPFTRLYVADLDAIKAEGNNNAVIENLLRNHPDLQIWLDAGTTDFADSTDNSRVIPVIGSETGVTDRGLIDGNFRREPVLSLDFSEHEFIGDAALLSNPRSWPGHIIAMSLGRVGTDQGPDMDRLFQIRKLAGKRSIYVAGGIRNEDDLHTLQSLNVAGVLVASALHRGLISKEALLKYS